MNEAGEPCPRQTGRLGCGEAIGEEALAGLYELLPRLAERLEAGVAAPTAVAAPRRTAKAGAPVPRRGRRAQA